jgi:hypothetical protein
MSDGQISGIWWLHPAAIFGIAGTGIGAAAYLLPEETYRTYWRTPKFFDGQALEVTLLCVAVFVFGSVCGGWLAKGRAVRPGGDDGLARTPQDVLYVLFRASFWFCLLGYVLWTTLAIRRGITTGDVLGVLTGEKGAIYEVRYTYLPTVGGVTTLTQFGSVVMVLGALLGYPQNWRLVWPQLRIVGLLALFRALINSERFAMIELAVPFLVTLLALRCFGGEPLSVRARTFLRVAPIAGVLGLYLLFTSFEYFRSWTNYYAGRELGLWEFGATRLLGYYVTSFNNGAYLLQRLEPLSAPYFTLHFLWGFPLTGPVVRQLFDNPVLNSGDKWFYFPFLESEANVEFNNADGMLFPLMDFGVAGGLLYWLLIGAVCGAFYRLYCRRQLTGLLLYPVVFLGLLEVPLALYWGEGRAFPSLCALAAAPLLIGLLRLIPRKPVLAGEATTAH